MEFPPAYPAIGNLYVIWDFCPEGNFLRTSTHAPVMHVIYLRQSKEQIQFNKNFIFIL